MKKGRMTVLFLMGIFMIAFMRVYSSALSEQQELSSVQDEIPFAYELVETLSAEDVNLWWAEQGYDNPPYKPGTSVMVLRLTRASVFPPRFRYPACPRYKA